MNEQITHRGTQKRLHTKFHTMNIMRSGARLIKYSISSNIRQARCGHALSIHKSRQEEVTYPGLQSSSSIDYKLWKMESGPGALPSFKCWRVEVNSLSENVSEIFTGSSVVALQRSDTS